MKTTLDLPDDLVRRLKIRAIHEGTTLKQLATDLLTRVLDGPVPEPASASPADTEPLEFNGKGFPVVRCRRDAPAAAATAAELIDVERRALLEEDLQRAGVPR